MSSSHLFLGLPIDLLVLYFELSSGLNSAALINHLSFCDSHRQSPFHFFFESSSNILSSHFPSDSITHSEVVSSRTHLHYPSQKRWLPGVRGIGKPPRRARRGAPACSHPHG